jgi:hypothetical protein
VHVRAGLDLLVGVDPDVRHDARLGADRDLVADRGALVDAYVVADVAGAANDGALDERAAADVGARIEHRPRRPRPLAERDAAREHGVRPDERAPRDARVVAYERGRLELLHVVDLRALADPDVAAQPDPAHVQPHLLVERIEVRLPVLVEVADVLPVAVHDVAVERAAHLEQEGEELLREVVRPFGRHVLQHLGLEHVDAGVDRVGEDLSPGRLLEEALDLALVVGDDDAELERVVDGLEPDRHRGALLAVEGDERTQVDVAERVAGDDEEGVVERVAREADGAGGAERELLDGILDVEPEPLPRAEIAADRLGQERERDDHVLEAVLLEELQDVLHARLADDRHHRLGLVRRERAQARALAAGHHDRLHVFTSRRALSTYWAAARIARATPSQKSQSGQSADGEVTIRRASAAYSTQVASLPTPDTSKS